MVFKFPRPACLFRHAGQHLLWMKNFLSATFAAKAAILRIGEVMLLAISTAKKQRKHNGHAKDDIGAVVCGTLCLIEFLRCVIRFPAQRGNKLLKIF